MTIPSIKLVKQWHKLFGVPVLTEPTIPNPARCKLRIDLIKEELQELEDAIEDQNIIDILDALSDLQYVLDGTYLEFGLEHLKDASFAEVHRSNMSKVGSDGQPIKREDGKILKGPYYRAPDFAPIMGGDYDTAE